MPDVFPEIELPGSTETSSIGVMHLRRYWEKTIARREGRLSQQAYAEEWNLDFTLLSALGIGLEQTIKHLYLEKPSFEEFEQWILQLNGGSVPSVKIAEFNKLVSEGSGFVAGQHAGKVLQQHDWDQWHNKGYVIIREAVPREDCSKTIDLICEFLNIQIDDPSTWYEPHPARQGIMVQMFQHPQLEKNRRSATIRAAYEELWNRMDLWCSADRVSFNPPENEHWKFPGPRLHWDVSLELPIPFGLQGLLYLSDTASNQGAFTLVPGFQHRIEEWIHSLPPGADPRTQNLYELGATPIAANAGDFIIWHQALPHGSSPNTSHLPRIVQYINYAPIDAEAKKKWK
jgi:hypothetical protein